MWIIEGSHLAYIVRSATRGMMAQYAFIMNQPQFPKRFLVEISRQAKTTKTLVASFDPDVIYCPSFSNQVLRTIIYNQKLFRGYRDVLKKTILEFLQQEALMHDTDNIAERQLINTVIQTIIQQEILKQLGPRRNTRHSAKNIFEASKEVEELRLKRLREEQHLQSTFAHDASRTKNEVKFVLSRH